MIRRVMFGIAAALLFVAGCSKQGQIIALDDRHENALSPDVQWAVVKEPYVVYRKDKSWQAATGEYERKGAILQVLGKSGGENGEVWYRFADGYLPESAVLIESNRYRAERRAATHD